jgi:hypothetical protein
MTEKLSTGVSSTMLQAGHTCNQAAGAQLSLRTWNGLSSPPAQGSWFRQTGASTCSAPAKAPDVRPAVFWEVRPGCPGLIGFGAMQALFSWPVVLPESPDRASLDETGGYLWTWKPKPS